MTTLSRRLIIPLTILYVLLIVHLLIATAQGTTTTPLAFWILAWAGAVPGAGALRLITLPVSRRQSIAARLAGWHDALVAACVVFLFALGLQPAPTVLQFHLFLSLGLLLTAAYRALFSKDALVRRWRVWLLVGGLAALVITVIRIYGLSVYPAVDIRDEPWVLSWALSFLRTGQFSDVLMHGMGDAYYAFPRFFLPMAWWLNLVGVGLWEARLFTFGVMLLTGVFTALAARNWFGREAGWLTAVIVFCSALLMAAARTRHDVGLALSVAVSLWLFTEAIKRERAWLHFAAGLVTAWGAFAHYHAAGLGAAMLISLYAPRYFGGERKRRLPEIGFWLYGVGGLVGALMVFVLQISADNTAGFLAVLEMENKYTNSVLQTLTALFYHVVYVARSPVEFALVVAGTVAAARRGRARDGSLVLMMILSHLVLAIMAAPAIYYYTVPLIPFYAILIASLFSDGLAAGQDGARRAALVGVLCFFVPVLGMTARAPLSHVLEGRPARLPAAAPAQWVLDNIETHETVAGGTYYYLWLHEYAYAADHIPDYVYPQYRGMTRDTIWETVNPKVFIVDENPDSYVFFKPLVDGDYFARHGYTVAAQFDDGGYPVTVYERESDE